MNPSEAPSSMPSQTHAGRLEALLSNDLVKYAALAVLVLMVRSMDLLFHFHDWDEASMMAQAWAMTKGQVLYKDIFQIHPVLQFAVFAPFFILFDPDTAPHAVKSLNLALVFFGAALVDRIGREWLKDRLLSFIAAVIFVSYLGDKSWSLSSYGEFYTLFPVLLSVHLLFFSKSPAVPRYLGVGLLWGTAFFLKQIALVDAAALFAARLWLGRGEPRKSAGRGALIAAGSAAVFLGVSAYFYVNDAFLESMRSMFVRPVLHYPNWLLRGPETDTLWARGLAKVELLSSLTRGLLAKFGAPLLSMAIAASSPGVGGKDPTGRSTEAAGRAFFRVLLFWFVLDLAGIFAIGRFHLHYLVQIVPAAALLSVYVLRGMDLSLRSAVAKVLLIALYGFAASNLIVTATRLRKLDWMPLQVRISKSAAEYVRNNTREGDRIFLYGVKNLDIFYLSGRLPGGGITMYPDMLIGSMHDRDLDQKNREAFVRDLPALIVQGESYVEVPFFTEIVRREYERKDTVEGLGMYFRKGG